MFDNKIYDVVFYYPLHFNRSKDNLNPLFEVYYKACERNNINFLILEEPSCIGKRSIKSQPFNFIFFFILIFRKIIPVKNEVKKDRIIGKIFKYTFLCLFRFKNVVVLSESMVSFFKGLNEKSKVFDLQHGIIYKGKSNYSNDNIIPDNLLLNDIHLLLYGNGFRNILLKEDCTNFMKNNSHTIGYCKSNKYIKHKLFNNKVLITLQFTNDHLQIQNDLLLDSLMHFVTSDLTVNYYLKQHPRFNNEVDISQILSLDNVFLSPNNIVDCFELCSLHVTAYSTSTFEAALIGIPTIIINPLIKFDYLNRDFNYPLNNDISCFKNQLFYKKSSQIVLNWVNDYYSDFDEKTFLNLLR
jgi:hypothetical protein